MEFVKVASSVEKFKIFEAERDGFDEYIFKKVASGFFQLTRTAP